MFPDIICVESIAFLLLWYDRTFIANIMNKYLNEIVAMTNVGEVSVVLS